MEEKAALSGEIGKRDAGNVKVMDVEGMALGLETTMVWSRLSDL